MKRVLLSALLSTAVLISGDAIAAVWISPVAATPGAVRSR